MVGPVSRGRTHGVSLVLGVALSVRTVSAADAEVSVNCPELSAEDAAQIEARVRANLLGASSQPTMVELSCEAASAQTQVAGNGQQVLQRAERSSISAKEALLASAEAALAAWNALATSPSTPPIAPVPAPAAEPVPAATPTPPPTSAPSAPQPRVSARSNTASTWLFAGPRAELWSSGWGLGAQLGLQQKLNSVFLALHGGYLVSLPSSTQFSARELQFGAQIGWQPQPLFGFRGALGIGLSLFGVSPGAGVSVENGSTRTLPCLSLELSRPVELGAFALLPAVGLRAFTSARSVLVDQQEVLSLPALALEASLSLALKVGG